MQENDVAAPPGRVPGSSRIHQDATHHVRADRKEMGPILPSDVPGSHEPNVRLINEGGGLQGLAATLAAHALVRETP